ncbi:hypothetical protein RI129_011764 [Pyrocoelia pectoralis]|uniref:Uncharacterized protein n=1 Tax=Pyrocoelia pectoralis TaxID=417401 RepID=A0AAN7ZD95_9COLE
MHQARWMARAIYSLKICLLQSQFTISAKDKRALQDVCLFIAVLYVKPWLGCSLAVKAPNQDLCFLKRHKEYETVDKLISKAALSKFSQHLWYLSEEIAVLSLFDDEVNEDMSDYLYRKSLSDFVSVKSTNLFSRLKIDKNFLQRPVSTWDEDVAYSEAKRKVLSLRAVNDTAERAVKLMQDFHGLITAKEEQK